MTAAELTDEQLVEQLTELIKEYVARVQATAARAAARGAVGHAAQRDRERARVHRPSARRRDHELRARRHVQHLSHVPHLTRGSRMTDLDLGVADAEIIDPADVDLLAAAERESVKRGLYDSPDHGLRQPPLRELGLSRDRAVHPTTPRCGGPFESTRCACSRTACCPRNLGDRNIAGRIRREYKDESDVRELDHDAGHPVARRAAALDAEDGDRLLDPLPHADARARHAPAGRRWRSSSRTPTTAGSSRTCCPTSEAIKSMLYLPVSRPRGVRRVHRGVRRQAGRSRASSSRRSATSRSTRTAGCRCSRR